jgi:hypothetical protein
MKTKLLLIFSVSVLTLLAVACKKESEGSTTLRIRMTDAPTALEEVNVDLQQVNIKFAHDSSSWVPMQTKAGVYNLLGLQNGLDTLIAEGTYPHGKVQEIRLVLGSNNSVKEGGETHPLTIPSGSESGLKIKVNKSLTTSLDSLLIDFDAALSIQQESSGYKLRPVVKLK